MSANIITGNNSGIISTGNNATNKIIHSSHSKEIDWDKIKAEIERLQKSPDCSIKKFASEASEAVEKKDSGKIKSWLEKWIPCVGGLLESSFYILEIASKFGINWY